MLSSGARREARIPANMRIVADGVVVLPANARDLLLPQSGRYLETDDTILAVNVDQASERLCGRPIRVYRFAAIDPALGFSCPGFRRRRRAGTFRWRTSPCT
jgi:hypothetical protein